MNVMSDMTPEKAQALLDAATPGPWLANGEPWNLIVWSAADNRVCFMAHSNGLDDERDVATAELVASAPDLASAYIAQAVELDRLRAKVEAPERMWITEAFTVENGKVTKIQVGSPHSSVFTEAFVEVVRADISAARIADLERQLDATLMELVETQAREVKPLEWHNFDAWTFWAEGVPGTYYVEERNARWRVELRVGGLVHFIREEEDTTPADLDAAKAAAQADYTARILSALKGHKP